MATLETTRDDLHGALSGFWPASIDADGLAGSTSQATVVLSQDDIFLDPDVCHGPLRYQLDNKVELVNSISVRLKILTDPSTSGNTVLVTVALIVIDNTGNSAFNDATLTASTSGIPVYSLYPAYTYVGSSDGINFDGVSVSDGYIDLTYSMDDWSVVGTPDQMLIMSVTPVTVDSDGNDLGGDSDDATIEVTKVTWDYEPTDIRVHNYLPITELDNATSGGTNTVLYQDIATKFGWDETVEQIDAVEIDLVYQHDMTEPADRWDWLFAAIGQTASPAGYWDVDWTFYPSSSTVDRYTETTNPYYSFVVGATSIVSSFNITGLYEEDNNLYRMTLRIELETPRITDMLNAALDPGIGITLHTSDDTTETYYDDSDPTLTIMSMRTESPGELLVEEEPPLPTPVPGTIDFPKLVGWHFYIDDRALIGGHAPELKLDYLLTRAENKSVTFDLYEPHQCSFTIDGKHPEASLVNELIHDVVAAREGEILFRGRIGSSSDSIDSDVHTVTFTANSYKAMLDRRVLHDTYDTTSGAVEQEEIAWEAIETSQNHIAGDLGITRGSDQQTGVLRADEWDIGTYIGEMIDDMSSRQYGFDWEIDEYLVFRVWPSFRGTNKGFPLEYGGTAVSVDRVFDASAFANWVWTQGTVASTSTWRGQYMSGLSSRPEGLWEMTQSAPDSRTADELTAIAAGELAKASSAVPAYTFTLRQGDWTGPDDFWLGDTVPVIIRTGRLNVVENYRVFRMVFNIDPNGLEELVVTAGSPELSLVQRLWKYGRRITNLENR